MLNWVSFFHSGGDDLGPRGQEDYSEVEENGSIVRRMLHSSMTFEELQKLMTRSSHGL